MYEFLTRKSAGHLLIYKACVLYLIVLSASSLRAGSDEILLDDYRNGLSSKWEEKSFRGKTNYKIIKDDRFFCIEAESRAAASALYYKTTYDLKRYPLLSWWWKVDNVLSKGDARVKQGDDYAGRIYVVFPSHLFWRTKAVNYIWANKLPQGRAVPNPYTNNAVMIAVESGPHRTGTWIRETRNVYADFRRYFDDEPPPAGAVAIMTDTDNTGQTARAWYGPIRLLSAAGPSEPAGSSRWIAKNR
jgi:hypothetical protein